MSVPQSIRGLLKVCWESHKRYLGLHATLRTAVKNQWFTATSYSFQSAKYASHRFLQTHNCRVTYTINVINSIRATWTCSAYLLVWWKQPKDVDQPFNRDDCELDWSDFSRLWCARDDRRPRDYFATWPWPRVGQRAGCFWWVREFSENLRQLCLTSQ